MLRTLAERLGTKRFFLFGARGGGVERRRSPCRPVLPLEWMLLSTQGLSPCLTARLPLANQASFSGNTRLYLHLPFMLCPSGKAVSSAGGQASSEDWSIAWAGLNLD